MWIDTHCHLDAPEFAQRELSAYGIIAQAAIKNVAICVLPAVEKSNFLTVQQLAHTHSQAYALGIHPLYVPQAHDDDLLYLDALLAQYKDDPRLVAVGEIGLDFFLPPLCTPDMRDKQTHFYRTQLELAKKHALPAILHVRKSADELLHGLRDIGVAQPICGIAHAFNGSAQQAEQLMNRGFCLGFGGAVTYERANNLRRLAQTLPPSAIVMETDAPDIAPHWIYATAKERADGKQQGINSPLELPRIGQVLADLRNVSVDDWAAQTTANALRVLPKLKALL
jgi:TatD DNase family protein